jgi:hypothetical protein
MEDTMRGTGRHEGLFCFAANDESGGEDGDETIVVPTEEELQALADEDVDELEQKLTDTFVELLDTNPSDPATVAQLGELAEGIERVRGEKLRRQNVKAEAEAEAEELRKRVLGSDEDPEADPDGDDGEAGDGDADPEAEATDIKKVEAKTEKPAVVEEPEAIAAAAKPGRVAVKAPLRINVPLSEIRARAPRPEAPPRLKITAAADVPRVQAGKTFDDIIELSYAYHERAKSTPIASSGVATGPKVATITNDFDHVLNVDSPPEHVERVFKEIARPAALVAGGGWCAPSETSYEFFDLACEDGGVDLPTVGIERGGLRFPTSPSLADVFTGTFTSGTNPWLWTETDDILTVTGSTNKPCVRVPCPGFNDVRLECYGICLTAGNLTDAAYPEATRHQIGLLRSAHFHAMNQRHIALMVAASTPVTTGGFFSGTGETFAPDILTAAGWAATDYRTRLGMCSDDIVEVVLPIWAREAFRADLARKGGIDLLAVTDAQIDNYFDVRSVRVQYVNDWQVRGANQPGGSSATTDFPATVQFMVYAAGTFVRGNGLTLDLGVIRDSTLNAENDHTALWTEECHLIAQRGPLSRVYTIGVCASGRVGTANLTCM